MSPALAEQPGAVSGVVRDQHSAPISNATIVARSSNDSVEQAKASSDPNGAYQLTGLKPGTYTIVADAPGFSQAMTQVVLLNTAITADLTLASQPAPLKFEAAGVRGFIDPGGYSVPAAAASASGLVTGMADIQRHSNASSNNWGCGVEADFKRAAESNAPQALLRLGQFYLARGRFQDAAPPLKLASDNKQDAITLRLLAEAYEGTGQFVEAASAYRLAASIDPSDENLFGAGYELVLSGSAESAAASFRNSLSIRPQSYRLWIGSGASEFLAGHTGAAENAFLQAVALEPNESAGYALLAQVVNGAGAASPASEAAFHRFFELAPQNAKALYYYALSLRRQNVDLEQSQSLLMRSIAIDPSSADAHLALGELFAGRGDKAHALEQYRQAVSLDPGLAQAHYRLALLYKLEGAQAEASAELTAFEAVKARGKSESTSMDLRPFVSVWGGQKTETTRQAACLEEKR